MSRFSWNKPGFIRFPHLTDGRLWVFFVDRRRSWGNICWANPTQASLWCLQCLSWISFPEVLKHFSGNHQASFDLVFPVPVPCWVSGAQRSRLQCGSNATLLQFYLTPPLRCLASFSMNLMSTSCYLGSRKMNSTLREGVPRSHTTGDTWVSSPWYSIQVPVD